MRLDGVELVMGVEEEFDISVRYEDAAEFHTVGEMFEHVFELIQKKPDDPRSETSWIRKAFRLDRSRPHPRSRDAVWKQFVEVVVEQLGVDSHQVVPEARFVEDLGVG